MLQPLEHYTKRRAEDLTQYPPSDGGNCRHGYGIPVMDHWGTDCAYCGRDLVEDYESWLHLSVDHVIPGCALKNWGERSGKWVNSRVNVVPCCRACNEFLCRYPVNDPEPAHERGFLALRDRVLREKRERALARHRSERAWYQEWRFKPLSRKAA